jgi:hypothetical protein
MISEFVMNHFWSNDRKMQFVADIRRSNEPHSYGYSIPENRVMFSYKNIKWTFSIT